MPPTPPSVAFRKLPPAPKKETNKITQTITGINWSVNRRFRPRRVHHPDYRPSGIMLLSRLHVARSFIATVIPRQVSNHAALVVPVTFAGQLCINIELAVTDVWTVITVWPAIDRDRGIYPVGHRNGSGGKKVQPGSTWVFGVFARGMNRFRWDGQVKMSTSRQTKCHNIKGFFDLLSYILYLF